MNSIPETIGIIMDGNRRFAKSKQKPTFWGHEQGFKNFKEIIHSAESNGVKNLIAYCFSSENWKRGESEVHSLISLFRKSLTEISKKFKSFGPVHFIGDRTRFSKTLQILMKKVEEKTKNNEGLSLYLALSYGGRDEIIRAAKKLSKKGIEITEKNLTEALDTKDCPDPDIIIRTGGEIRLSNFLSWQSIYSELFFTKTLWPDFTKDEFAGILSEYGKRKRNFGS